MIRPCERTMTPIDLVLTEAKAVLGDHAIALTWLDESFAPLCTKTPRERIEEGALRASHLFEVDRIRFH